MQRKYARYAAAGFCFALFTLAPCLTAQQAPSHHIGSPQDWSTHHILFTRAGLAQHPDLMDREPRVRQQVMQRWQIPNYGKFESRPELPAVIKAKLTKSNDHQRDWQIALGGHMAQNAFPTKWNYYADSTPDCTADFVVYGLNNTNGANLVGLNNLYSGVDSDGTGICGSGGPNVLFAYNITTQPGGHIITSPVVSLDGTQVTFVESVPANPNAMPTPTLGQCYFHVVSVNQGAVSTIMNPVVPTQITLPISTTASDTHSSPYVDFGNDIVYVGSDDGYMHQITGVFSGSPTVDPSGWPVLIGAGLHFSSPTRDENLNVIMVGASNGYLYQLTPAGGMVSGSLQVGIGLSAGIVAAPIVDIINGTTFVVTADYTGDGGMTAAGTAAIVQVDTKTVVQRSFGELGEGASARTAVTLYEPAFSNDYYNDPTTGIVTLCGTGAGDTSPWQYAFEFHLDMSNFVVMTEMPTLAQQLLTSASTSARCTGWTEFFNPNIPAMSSGTDYFFFGLTEDCTMPGAGTADGCVAEETNLTPSTSSASIAAEAQITGGPSGIVVDNYADPTVYPEASSIYFTAWRLQEAYKLTQDGLQ